MILALALSASLDVTYQVELLQRGAISRPFAVTRVAGGKALNVARVAHALGAEVQVVVGLGGHTGAQVAQLLDSEGVPTVVVPFTGDTRTCTAIVEDGDRSSSTDIYEPAAPVSREDWRAFREAVEATRAEVSWVDVSGSIPEGVPAADLRSLLQSLRGRGAKVAVDSSGPGLHALVAVADLVKVNLSEASELLENRPGAARDSAESISARWGCNAVVTDGVKGGWAVFDGDGYELSPPQRLGRFPAGSGDAFLGGLLTALDARASPQTALRVARETAERNAQVPGQGRL